MQKSSLGRRSSMMSNANTKPAAAAASGSASGSKKSMLMQPGFLTSTSQSVVKRPRASSAERDTSAYYGGGGRDRDSFFKRSMMLQTPKTPRDGLSTRQPPPSKSARRARASSAGSLNESRMSSIGISLKTGKKELRPIEDKKWQGETQQKIQNYFKKDPQRAVVLDGGKMAPMTTTMFVGMVNYLAQSLHHRIEINKQNYMEECQKLARFYLYKGKLEKSWLLTVNAQHAWRYVLAFLEWLVDMNSALEDGDIYEMMHPSNVLNEDEATEENHDLMLKMVHPYLIKGYKEVRKNPNSDDNHIFKDFMGKYRTALGVGPEQMEHFKVEHDRAFLELKKFEDCEEENKIADQLQYVQNLKHDVKSNAEYLEEKLAYCEEMEKQVENEMAVYESLKKRIEVLEKKKADCEVILKEQSAQGMDKQQINAKIESLQMDVQSMKELARNYEERIRDADFTIMGLQKELKTLYRDYNEAIMTKGKNILDLEAAVIVTAHMGSNPADYLSRIDVNLVQILENLETELKEFRESAIQTKKAIEEMETTQKALKNDMGTLETKADAMKNELILLQEREEPTIKEYRKECEKLRHEVNERLSEIEELKLKLGKLEKEIADYLKQTEELVDDRLKVEELSVRYFERRKAQFMAGKKEICGVIDENCRKLQAIIRALDNLE